MKHTYSARYKNLLLRPLERDDIEQLRNWRNDTYATRFLRPIGHITPEMQERWYKNYLVNSDEITFAIVETSKLNRLIGSLTLYNFCDGKAEIGKIQIGDVEAQGNGYGGITFVMAMLIGFKQLGLNKIYASVHQENLAAYKNYQRVGMRLVGSHPSIVGGLEDEIEIDEKQLYAVNQFAREIKLDIVDDII